MKITPEQLVQNLADSGLMSAEEASSLCRSVSTVTGPSDVDTLVQELAGTGQLTAYQAECICRGEAGGLVFDEYVVLDKIGQGGMGVVLKARHGRMDRTVAVKKLPPEMMDTKDAVERFYREVKVVAGLSHPKVEFTGFVPDVLPYMQAADVGVNPIETGSVSNVKLIEYFACGLPVVTTPFGREDFEDLAPWMQVCRIEAFAQAIEAARWPAAIPPDVIQRHSWSATARVLADFYRSLKAPDRGRLG